MKTSNPSFRLNESLSDKLPLLRA
jgi:hypothetical protein